MTAPRRRAYVAPRVRIRETSPALPLRNDKVMIVTTFNDSGMFEIDFAPYEVRGNGRSKLRRIPTRALSMLRPQLLATHNELWLVMDLSVNPQLVSETKTLIRPRRIDGVITLEQRTTYVKLLQKKFNTACKQAGVKASMTVTGLPEQQPKVTPAKKVASAPAKKTTSTPKAATSKKKAAAQKVPTKKAAAKKATAKKLGATKEPRRRIRR